MKSHFLLKIKQPVPTVFFIDSAQQFVSILAFRDTNLAMLNFSQVVSKDSSLQPLVNALKNEDKLVAEFSSGVI